MNPSQLLKRLLAYLFPAKDDGDDDLAGGFDGGADDGTPASGTDGAHDDGGADDSDLGDDGTGIEADGAHDEDDLQDDDSQQQGQPPTSRSRASERIRRQQEENRQLKERLAALEARTANNPPPAPQGPAQDAELQQFAARANDPNLSELERWQAKNDFRQRYQELQNQTVMAEARDLRDQAAFDRAKAETPILARYEKRVNEEVARLRAAGQQVPPRQVIAELFAGRDLVQGNLKTTRRNGAGNGNKTGTQQGAPRLPQGARGRPAGARSDVPPTRGLTRLQQLEKKLTGVKL